MRLFKRPLKGCEGEDAIAFSTGIYRGDKIASVFKYHLPSISGKIVEFLKQSQLEIPSHIFQTGVGCEILSVNSKGWRKGKIKVKFELEFIPDEIEESQEEGSSSLDSSLDSLRTVTQ